jgi:hypothetical protein
MEHYGSVCIFCQRKLTTKLYGVFIFYGNNLVTPIQLCIMLHIKDLASETLYKDLLLEIWTALGPKAKINT